MLHKKKFLAVAPAIAILVFAMLAGMKMRTATASPVVLKGHKLYLADTTLGEKKLPLRDDVEILFDQKAGYVLFGKGWTGAAPESENHGGTILHVMRADGSGERRVTDDLVREAFLDPAATRIYYVTREQDLYVEGIGGSGKKRLAEKVLGVSLSPKGGAAAYQKLNPDWSVGDYFDRAMGLTVFDLAKGEEKRISTAWEDFAPVWTPDGAKILFFSRSPEGLASHFIMNADGSGRRQLTNLGQKFVSDRTVPVPSERPIWSKDGRVLVYESDRQIWVNEFSPGIERVVGARPIVYGKHPEWTKDGKTLRVLVGQNGDFDQGSFVNVDLTGKILR